MPGTSSITGDESILFADNISLDGTERGGAIDTDGQMWIGNTAGSPSVRKGVLTSPDLSITWGYDAPNITGNVSGFARTNITNGIGISNFGLSYTSGVYTMKTAIGSSLSSSERGYVTLPYQGYSEQLKYYDISSALTWNDSVGGSSIFAGSLFGFDTGDTTTTGVPFYLYFIARADDTYGMLAYSRVPGQKITSSNVYDAGSGGADLASDFLLVFPTGDAAGFHDSYCVMVGCDMLNINGSDDWARYEPTNFSAYTGIGRFFEGIPFSHYPGTCGAATDSIFANNSGTAPTTTTFAQNSYKIDPWNRQVNWDFSFRTSGSPAGDVSAMMLSPIRGAFGRQISFFGAYQTSGTSDADQTNVLETVLFKRIRSDSTQFNDARYFGLWKGNNTSAMWQYSEFYNGTGAIMSGTVSYYI